MPINYVVRKKKDQSGNEVKELYYAVPSAIQNKGVSEKQLAEDLHDNSSLSAGDVLSVLEQLPKAIARHMKEGRTVTIRGLGTFYPALSSEGCETPEECTPNKVRLTRICFRADTAFTYDVKHCEFESMQLRFTKRPKPGKEECTNSQILFRTRTEPRSRPPTSQ